MTRDIPLPPPVAGVIGWPIAQSKSPIIHRFWLNALGLEGDYLRFPVRPGQVAEAIAGVRGLGLAGINVTAPYKREVMAHLDHVEPAAAAIGAVNTIWRTAEGALFGTNSDVAGFLEPLAAAKLESATAVVLGTGGAAAAVLQGLKERDIGHVVVAARNHDAARALLDRFSLAGTVQDLDQALPRDTALLVNATSLGMVGKPPLALDLSPLPDAAIVYDLVYAPLETDLLKAARARKLPTVTGIAMLIGQAAVAFRHFYGATPPRAYDAELQDLLLGE